MTKTQRRIYIKVETNMINKLNIIDTEMTQDELYSFLHYDPDTGIFTYTKTVNPRAAKGQSAGTPGSSGHLQIQYKKRRYQLSHLAFIYMLGEDPKEVDHINRVPWDNRWSNLRKCDRMTNMYNASLRSDNTSGVKGVSWNKRARKWRVRLYVDGKEKFIGEYHCLQQAAEASEKAREIHHGEFACLI